MSQFRVKKIDTGIPDEWVYRINDDGIVIGDDVVAEDPNELALALSETQDLILHASVYAPTQLIDPAHGVLERIKTIEDTFGTTTLQDAYDNGRFITVQPGRNLAFGSNGEIELDSNGNLKFNTNTFKLYNGTLELNLAYNQITSLTTDLTFGTLSPTKDTTIRGGRNLYLKDSFLSTPVALSQTGNSSLTTAANSIIGAINEINNGFNTASLQRIYDQSTPPTITTSFTKGPFKVVNGSGNPSSPAMQVLGGIECIDFLDVDSLTVGPGAVVNLTIASTGSVTTIADIKTSTKFVAPRLENNLGDLTLADIRGSATLTQSGDSALNTTKKSLFGAINELNSLGLANGTSLAALDLEHNLANGNHEIITTKASTGTNSTSRFNVYNDSNILKVSIDAMGAITCSTVYVPGYELASEAGANYNHRTGDGTDHSAVSSHLSASNPHNTVKSIAVSGQPQLTGIVTFNAGPLVTLTQLGSDITIGVTEADTLQSVYGRQSTGVLTLDTTSSKNLYIKNSSSDMLLGVTDLAITPNRNIKMDFASASITGNQTLRIESAGDLTLKSTNSDTVIDATSTGKHTIIDGVDFSDTVVRTITTPMPQSVIGALNEVSSGRLISLVNATGYTVSKGQPVIIRSDGKFWIPYNNIDKINMQIDADSHYYWTGFGVVDSATIANGASGTIRTGGVITADIGAFSGSGWKIGDTLYAAQVGKAKLSILSFAAVSNGDTFTLDSGSSAKVFTATTGTPSAGQFAIQSISPKTSNAAADITRQNIINAINDESYMLSGSPFMAKAFTGGEKAKGKFTFSGIPSAGEVVVLKRLNALGNEEFETTLIATTIGAPTTVYPLANTPDSGTLIVTVNQQGNPVVLTVTTHYTLLGSTVTLTGAGAAIADGKTIDFDYIVGGSQPVNEHFAPYYIGVTADETAINLAEAINQTTDSTHLCIAYARNNITEVTYTLPGFTGNDVQLTTTSGTITPANLSGGTCVVEIYKARRTGAVINNICSDATAMSISDFSNDYGSSPYVGDAKFTYLDDGFYNDSTRKMKFGRVLSYSAPNTTFLVDIAGPELPPSKIKGLPYGAKY